MNGTSFSSLEEAVLCFYQSNNILQSEAQKWLTELQSSPQIWNIIWDDLLPSKHTELQFYGATLLHAKLLKDWSEIPSNQYEPLKSKLLEGVIYFKDGPKVVLNRLCISLAVFILRTTPIFWPNAVSDLITLFQNAVTNVSSETLSWLLLEILCVIPEEFSTVIFSKNEKIFARSSLENDSLTVISLLEAVLPSTNIDIKLQSVRCAKSWLEFGLPPENCDNLLNLLINAVLLTYKNADTSQCSISAIEAISTLCNHPNIEKFPKRVLSYLEKILSLADILNSSQDVPNTDIIPCLYTLFVSIGESHIKKLIPSLTTDQREIFLKLVYVILKCMNAPGSYPKDEIYSSQTFTFWYLLRDEAVALDCTKTEIMDIIKPLYKKLVNVLLEKSMQPESFAGWMRDDRDAFRCYRQDIADTYTYCYAVLDTELLDIILHDLERLIADPNVISEWRKLESYLHAFNAISENAMCSASPKILNGILLLEKLPFSNMNVQISQTVMELIGSYAEWLCSNPELLGPVLSLVFIGAENAQLASPATLALKDITRECKSVIFPYAEQIAQKTTELLKRRHLKPSEEVRLIFSLGTVVSLLPMETIFKYLDDVVTPYVLKLQKILTETQINAKKAEQEIIDCVGVFTQLFLGLDVKPPYPIYCLLEKILPMLRDVLTQYKAQKIVDETCIAIKCAVSNLSESCSDLLPMIVNIIITTYSTNPNHPLLELAKQLLILFGNNSTCAQLMSDMLKELCVFTLNTFENTSPENVSEHTSLFEHFYSFCTNVLKKNCKLLLFTDGINLVLLFRYAGYALCAQETLTVKSAASFLCNVITISREQDSLLVVVQTHGAELVYHILIAIGKVSPRNCLEHVADVLVALSKKYCDWLSRWLNDILTQEGFPSPRATSATKKRFIKAVLREKANKRKVQDTTKEFSFICRGLINKDYVDQTTSAL